MQTEALGEPTLASPAADEADRKATGRRWHAWTAAGLVVLGGLIRLILIAWDWPETNSDEGYQGLQALHIAAGTERPTFFPGQAYMGPHEAYLGAALFHLFGNSLFSLRLGLVLMFVLFLVSSYWFARIVYGPRWALISLALLALGSPYVLSRELTAMGGYGETLLFSSLMFLVAARLVTTYEPYRVLREQRWRLALYAAWGVAAGTGLWADLLVAPFALASGLALLIHCRRELLQLVAPVSAGIGLVIGMLPLLVYNLNAPPGGDSISTLTVLRGQAPEGLSAKAHAAWNAVTQSVPMMTGNPVCPVDELPALNPVTSWSSACYATRVTWGTGYMLLLGLGTLLAVWAVWQAWRRRGSDRPATLHLAMLVGGLITFYLYANSDAAVGYPGGHSRYLIGLVVALPAVFHTLVAVAKPRVLRVAGVAILAAYTAALAFGTVRTFMEIPRTHADALRSTALVETLRTHGVKHFYGDYWTCARIAFRAEESITCGAVTDTLEIAPNNRYYDQWTATTADPRAAYVFSDNPCRSLPYYKCDKPTTFLEIANGTYRLPVVEAKLEKAGTPYQLVHIDGYVIYLIS
ncbi:ArnT family glycosyltransferase [Dactylosporangium sp. CS-033363]|uniref:ArnT family glycosyltransferase n=1 Tax=Dactylosporangium sp. CS-033363 TaxID=3239935 RepID=UPI003D89D94D